MAWYSHTARYSLEYATFLRRATLQLRPLGAARSHCARTPYSGRATRFPRCLFQTVNYVRSPFRFTLTMSDPALIGARRAAQRVAAAAAEALGSDAEASDAAVAALVREGLAALC